MGDRLTTARARTRLDHALIFNTVRGGFEELLAPDAEELFQQRGVARVRLERGEDNVARDGYEAHRGGDRVVHEHLAEKPSGYPGSHMVSYT